MHICAWQSADSRVTTDHCRVTLRWVFTKSFLIAWNVQKRCLTVSRRSRDLRPLSRDRSATFFKIRPNCLKRPKNVVWQSADGRVTSDHCRVTVQRLFSKFSQIAWNVQKTLFDSRPTVAWPPTTVAWPFSDFFQKISNCLKRRKIVVWQSADSRVTSDHCRVTVQQLFSKYFLIAWNVQKTLFDSRPTVAWPPTTVAWPFSDFFQNFPKLLETSKNVVWQLADGRVTSDHCRVTVQQLFSKNFLIAWNVQKTLFDSRPTVAWPPTTVAWPFSDFFQNFPKLLETSKNVVWQSADGRVTSDHCRVTVQRLFPKKISNCLKRPKNVVWQSADGRVTSDHCRVTVQRLLSKFSQIAWTVQKRCFDSQPTVAWPRTTVAWPFSDFFQIFPKLLETSKNRCLTVGRRSRDLRPLSRDRSATFFKKFSNCLKRPKNVVWQSADGRVTSDHCRVTVQRLFSNFSQMAWNVEKSLFDSRPTVARPPTTVTWPFSDFFQKIFYLLEKSKKRCLTVGRWSRDLQPLSRDRSATFFKIFPNCLKHPKNVVRQWVDGRVTSDHCRVTVQWLFSNIFLIAWNV